MLKLKPAQEGSALQDHVITSVMVKRVSSCLAHCYVEENCVSYNLGPKLVDDTHKCELSNSDHLLHPEDLVGRDGFIYQPIEVRIKLHTAEIQPEQGPLHMIPVDRAGPVPEISAGSLLFSL